MKRHLILSLLVLTLSGCLDNDTNTLTPALIANSAVIAGRASDYSSGATSLVELNAPFTARNNLAATVSDIVVRSGGDHYFVIERFMNDRIKRYSTSNPGTAVYTYSTKDASDTQSSNPYDLLIVNADKAYLLRYGSGTLWIVNPSAATEGAFKIGEIDLSAYDADGVPEMSAGLIHDGRLYVAMQRLESFAATQSGYVAVIDIATDLEIDTDPVQTGLNGIELPVRNPVRLLADASDNSILAVASGGFDGSFAALFEGGIVRISTTTFATTSLLDDGDNSSHPYGQITDAVLAASDRAYFIGDDPNSFGDDQTLYRFDPTSVAPPVTVAGFGLAGLTTLAVDAGQRLWLGRSESAAPGVNVLGFENGAESIVSAHIDTVLAPINIDFVTVR